MIKIFDPSLAGKLAGLGFSYVMEQINGKTVFAFEENEQIMDFMRLNYQQTPFYKENKLRF